MSNSRKQNHNFLGLPESGKSSNFVVRKKEHRTQNTDL